ncbi:MAG: bifunctional metallophosphatase/5'-nucleotidase, partial [Propionibacterium sp.]|nr:bifunctional metallophosphatase/5'-nucleotidase [Propionibacterium sp.]
MSKFHRRSMAGLAATALGLSGAIVASVPGVAAAAEECVAETTSIQIFSFNDFHGRVEGAANLFTVVEEARAALGEDNVLLTSNGDSIGGSTFVSAVADDNPTLDVLQAAGLEVSAAGNHEFDKGWSDLSGRVVPHGPLDQRFPYVAANVLDGAGNVAAPLKAYELFEKGGVTIAVVGAVTRDLPSLVSPSGIAELDIIDPVEAVNSVAADLKDGDDSNGEADIVIASIHEGAPSGSPDAATGAESSQNFADIYNDIHESVDVVFNGHTHYQYDW